VVGVSFAAREGVRIEDSFGTRTPICGNAGLTRSIFWPITAPTWIARTESPRLTWTRTPGPACPSSTWRASATSLQTVPSASTARRSGTSNQWQSSWPSRWRPRNRFRSLRNSRGLVVGPIELRTDPPRVGALTAPARQRVARGGRPWTRHLDQSDAREAILLAEQLCAANFFP
jgi:hypothetical protein